MTAIADSLQAATLKSAMHLAAVALLGSDVFARVQGAVNRWADREISGVQKREAVLNELEVIGIRLVKAEANFAIEAAVQILRIKSGGVL